MKKIQVQGLHHITIVGSTRQSAIDFWEGLLGMPFVFEQPNLGKADENHLYFDPGDGRLLTVFTNESREDAARPAPRESGCVEHIAFNVSRATHQQVPQRLRERGIPFLERDRGFMDSIYLQDPNGMKIELACYKFQTPDGSGTSTCWWRRTAFAWNAAITTSTRNTWPTRSSRCVRSAPQRRNSRG